LARQQAPELGDALAPKLLLYNLRPTNSLDTNRGVDEPRPEEELLADIIPADSGTAEEGFIRMYSKRGPLVQRVCVNSRGHGICSKPLNICSFTRIRDGLTDRILVCVDDLFITS
jgi:hypothetical protein